MVDSIDLGDHVLIGGTFGNRDRKIDPDPSRSSAIESPVLRGIVSTDAFTERLSV